MLFRIIVLILYVNSFCSAQTPYTLTPADKNQILDYHNKLRSQYPGLLPFVWDDSLMNQAGTYAQGCKFVHSSPGNPNYGENLAVNGASPQPTTFPFLAWKNQLDGWKAEDSSWDCMNNVCPSGVQCGHLTAMIWNGTTKVGCGVAKCDPGTIYSTFWSQYIVCQYAPPGNFGGQHPLLAPKGPPCTICPSLPTPQVITSSGAPTAPTNPPANQPTAPLGTIKPQQPTAPPAVPMPTGPPPAFPPASPGAVPWSKCIADFWPNGKQQLTPCKAQPKTISRKLYCDCGDPNKYLWPVWNSGSSDCTYIAKLTDDDVATQDDLILGLTQGAWIGIACGIAGFIIIVIVVVIIIKKSNEDERV
jgi:hypothetical protein